MLFSVLVSNYSAPQRRRGMLDERHSKCVPSTLVSIVFITEEKVQNKRVCVSHRFHLPERAHQPRLALRSTRSHRGKVRDTHLLHLSLPGRHLLSGWAPPANLLAAERRTRDSSAVSLSGLTTTLVNWPKAVTSAI